MKYCLHRRPAVSARNSLVAIGMAFCLASGLARGEAFSVGGVMGWTPEQTPMDFLDVVGLQTKARWRQLYREPPPSPSAERHRTAFTLGGLVADGLLALQAEDSQQFRNNVQDIMGYSRVLGLSDKVTPRLMAQGKLAELEKWTDLRQEVVDGQQELARLLREQHDEDLAVLLELGVWLRILEMSSQMVAASENDKLRPICIGSMALIEDLRRRYTQLGENARKITEVAQVDELLEFLQRHWSEPRNDPPSAEFVVWTHEKIGNLMRKLTLK